ncbi:MAG TPA: SLBB domain-containing protein [Candidatus Limnocylindria bacterium]|nr:SLBB domain-containing protein [Candidatus Limnocylindria bacterium]
MFQIGKNFRYLASVVILAFCVSAHAQGTVETSISSRDILDRVGMSAPQIQEALLRDPEVLLELKRWVAKDAFDNGQVVSDSDLKDQAIFDRLHSDSEFRAVATQLLERSNHWSPETAARPEIDRKRDGAFSEQPRTFKEEENISPGAAAPPLDVDAPDSLLSRRLVPNPLGVSQSANGRLTQASESADAGTPRGPGEGELVGSTQEMMARGEHSAMKAELSERATISGAPLGADAGPEIPKASGPGRYENTSETPGPPVMVRRANPFADIPSLYDMYQQSAPPPAKLARFGIDVFRNGIGESNPLPMDMPVGPEYVVGPGDGLSIDLWGGVSQRLYRIVDREGRLALPEAGPVLVSGRTLGEVQQAVQQILRTQFRDVSADVSLSRLRTIRVYVVGDVEHPGAYDISSLSTPLNAVFKAGGPTSRGSLRILKHFRGNQLVQEVDVYDLLLHGIKSDLARLQNGDSVLLPPIGAQVTVEGMVHRPAIYELKGEKNLAQALELAGGILPTATLRHIEVQRIEAHQKRTMLSLDVAANENTETTAKELESFAIQNEDVVNIFPIVAYNQEAVFLEGHVLRPGRYSYQQGMKLTDLISSYNDLPPEPAAKYAEIVRLNPPDYHPSVESFDLAAALTNPEAAPKIEPMDTVRIFSRYDFENAPTVSVGGAVRMPGTYWTAGEVHLSDAIHLAGGLTPDALMENAQVLRYLPDSRLKVLSVSPQLALAGDPLHNILLAPRDRILIHQNPAKVDPPTVFISGEVAKPGKYPLTSNLHVADLIQLAGGFKRSAYTDSADLTRYLIRNTKTDVGEHMEVSIPSALSGDPASNLLLRDGDVLTIAQLPGWSDVGASVSIRGEVQHAGVYGIKPGERLSSLLRRAGGLLPTAYPQAAVFERVEVRELQEKSRQELIQRLEQESTQVKTEVSTTGSEEAALQQTALQQRQRMLEALRKAPVSGRLVIHLRNGHKGFEGSPDDIELRAGDSLTIPKLPGFVVVVGQVYNANALTYAPKRNAGWYLSRAGGATPLAKTGATFIVRSDGSVTSGKQGGMWSGGALSAVIGPGDTIIVPERPVLGSNTWKNVLAIAQIAQAGALAAAVAIP